MSDIYAITNTLIEGDPLNPSPLDIIFQKGALSVRDPVPVNWRVISENKWSSLVMRVAYRYEIAEEQL